MVPDNSPSAHPPLDALRERVSPSTFESYRKAWARFERHCEGKGVAPLQATAGHVVDFIADPEIGRSASTLRRYRAAIRAHFEVHGLPSPTETDEFADMWQQIEAHSKMLYSPRDYRSRVVPADWPVHPELSRVLGSLPEGTTSSLRSRALLLLAAAAELSAGEAAELRPQDVHVYKNRVEVQIPSRELWPTVQIRRPQGDVPDVGAALDDWLRRLPEGASHLFPPLLRGGRIRSGGVTRQAVLDLFYRLADRAGVPEDVPRADLLRHHPTD